MKNLLKMLAMLLLISTVAFAQNAPIDFETGGFGASWTWSVFENASNPALEIVTNPDASGINTSATVAKFTALEAGQPWAGTHSAHGSDIGTFTLDATNSTVKIMVYKTKISDVGIKFATASDASFGELKVANTLVNEWEELTFDFSGFIGHAAASDIDQLVIFPDFSARAADDIIYFDNVSFSEKMEAPGPDVAAPTPTAHADSVVSLFSDAYTDVPVSAWSTDWDNTNVTDTTVAGNATKLYTNLVFAGIEFATVDASNMTRFHMDIWTPDATNGGQVFKVKLVDYGSDGAYGGADDVEHELTFSSSSTPALATGSWVALDVPLSDFTGLITKGHLAQMIISGDPNTVWVDNLYFYDDGAEAPEVPAPAVAAPAPAQDAENVISLYSDAYTDVTVNTWSADWDVASVVDTNVAGNATKLYTGLSFAGIEFTSPTIDASSMTHFHLDIWTPDATDGDQVFKIKLVDFGADGVWGTDDVEHEIVLSKATTPAIASEQWVGLDIPLSDFTGLTSKGHLAQMIISGDLGTIWVDNVYLYAEETAPLGPVTAAPTPTVHADSVVSLYSDAYSNETVSTWSADWDMADVSDTSVSGNATKLYTNLSYAGIEFATVDASDMRRFHMDIWTPDAVDGAQIFKIKLVDFGADGAYAGGDDVEHELTFTASSTPALASGEWVAIDVPLSDFTGLITTGHLAQMIISGDPNTVWIDNVYFYDDGSGPVVVPFPTLAAPTPTAHADSVVSLFSDAYTDITVSTWSADWDVANVSDTTVAGNATKLYTGLSFAGIEFTADASLMTHFHMDIWTPDATDGEQVFKIKLVDFGADASYGGGDDVEHEVILDKSSIPAIASEQWVGLDIPLSEFAGLLTRGAVSQMIISGDLSTVWVDNVYFRADSAVGQPGEPLVAAPLPTEEQKDVISLFSDVYDDVPVSTWSADWDVANVADVMIAGDTTKLYTGLVFAGIEFSTPTIDASEMEYFHMDIWTPDSTALPKTFNIKLVDYGADGVWSGGGDDVEHELTFSDTSMPALRTGNWVSFDIPLADFTGLLTKAHLSQMILSGDLSTIYVDNIYFYREPQLATPLVAAPTPTEPAAEVVSVFSNAYTNVPVSTFSTDWDWASVEDVQISGDDVKKYTSTGYAGIEFSADATTMTHFHMDLWTPDSVADAEFKVKLVDFGNNGVYGGGDDVEHELTFTDASTPALATAEWVGIDVPLAYFAGLSTRGHLSQMILSGPLGTFYVDNIYFYIGDTAVPEPDAPAPTPTFAATDVISLFSNAYTNVSVDTWSAVWDNAVVEDIQIAGNDVKKYTGLSFAGIEFPVINATDMTHFHMDIWTPDSTKAPAEFKIKLVDYGANGTFDGGDDVEHEIVLTSSTVPALSSLEWVGLDIPMSDFSGLTTRGALAQMIISGDPNTVYVDNVYFYKTETAVEDLPVPTAYALEQNYPNPFNPATSIRFSLPEAGMVTMTLYNMLGQEVMTLLNEHKEAGSYETRLDASSLPTGTYFYSIISGDFKAVRKMVLIK